MLGYGPCQEVNTETSMVEDSDIEDLRAAGWGEQGVYEATALISLFNYSGRTEAASGLPVGRIPEEARLPEATLGKATAAQARAWEDSKGTRDSVEASLKLPGDASYRGAPVANIRFQTEPISSLLSGGTGCAPMGARRCHHDQTTARSSRPWSAGGLRRPLRRSLRYPRPAPGLPPLPPRAPAAGRAQ